jgi:transcriptional regulator with XRE-family HTH domain
MDELPVVSKRIREARIRSKLSQERLGVMAGIDEFSASARMNQYERGRHTPNYQLVNRLAEVLGLPTAYFYAEDDQLAELLVIYGRLTVRARKRLIDLAGEL